MPTWIIQAPTGPTNGMQLVELIGNITNWVFAFFMVGAAVFVVLAGWQFMSSQGDPNGVAQARTKLLWAVVAIAAGVLSLGIVTAVTSIVGG